MIYKILVVGSGAREHAIIKSLNNSRHQKEIYCIASNMNPGINELCEDITIKDINSCSSVVRYAQEKNVQMAIIGPENPLATGVSDALWNCNIKVVGPKKDMAQIETSKSFTRDLFKKYQIPGGAQYKTFYSMDGVSEFLQKLGNDYVVKFDGLAGGKGVKVSGEHIANNNEAIDYCQEIIDSGGKFVIEEKFVGEEFSLMSFCDGKSLKHMPIVQDHKRAYEGDSGPNTGGMGTYTDSDHLLPFLNTDDVNEAKMINKATINALRDKYDDRYKGILYGGFMATRDGVKLIEYNARFGDPEAMNVLSLLETDFIDICFGITNCELDEIQVQFKKQATVCKYAVPEGYPDNPTKGQPININNITNLDQLYYASVDIENGQLIESGSRTMAVVGMADTISEAEVFAEREVSSIIGPLFHREDIGKDFLIKKRIDNMNSLR